LISKRSKKSTKQYRTFAVAITKVVMHIVLMVKTEKINRRTLTLASVLCFIASFEQLYSSQVIEKKKNCKLKKNNRKSSYATVTEKSH